MQLFFHIGLNKAGSTFLQNLFSYNKENLVKKGIYYSGSAVSKGIGGAQDGNAADLTAAIRDNDIGFAHHFLKNMVRKAKKNRVESILLSNESMYHQLVDPGKSKLLKKACDNSGINAINLLVVFRDPVSHSISAYTHRSGLYDMPSFHEWIENGFHYKDKDYKKDIDGYEFWQELPMFLDHLSCDKSYNLHVGTCSEDLKLLAENFLGTTGLKKYKSELSNVSVNCVEAELLRLLSKNDKRYTRRLRGLFKELPKPEKAADSYLKNLYQGEAFDKVLNFSNELDRLSNLLKNDNLYEEVEPQKRCFDEKFDLFSKRGNPYFLLSLSQINAIIDATKHKEPMSTLVVDWLKKISYLLPSSIRGRMVRIFKRINN